MIFAARILIKLGAKNVFIKGGHLESKIVQDIFVNKNEIFIIKNKRIKYEQQSYCGKKFVK